MYSIRKGVFETSSSSVHALILSNNEQHNGHEVIPLYMDTFDRDYKLLNDIGSKARYIYTLILETQWPRTKEYVDWFINLLNTIGTVKIVGSPKNVYGYDKYNCEDGGSYYRIDGDGIDHQSLDEGLIRYFRQNPEMLKHWILSEDSFILTFEDYYGDDKRIPAVLSQAEADGSRIIYPKSRGLLGFYKNGNTDVSIYEDGTKIRTTSGSKYEPEFAESIDVCITNRCRMGCPYCYAGAGPGEPHPDILDYELLDTIPAYTEIAINGNDMDHPDLEEFLETMYFKNVIVNMTVHAKQMDVPRLARWQEKGYIHGIGISNYTGQDISSLKHVVLHEVIGVLNYRRLWSIRQYHLPILFLGYKQRGRGADYYSDQVKTRMNWARKNPNQLKEAYWITAFDNLALEQVHLKEEKGKDYDKDYSDLLEDDSRFMGGDGMFSFYLNLVDKTYSKSSNSEEKFPMKRDVREMFQDIRKKTLEEDARKQEIVND